MEILMLMDLSQSLSLKLFGRFSSFWLVMMEINGMQKEMARSVNVLVDKEMSYKKEERKRSISLTVMCFPSFISGGFFLYPSEPGMTKYCIVF